MTISLCMIVKDEAATLAQCLDSVEGVVDEIIVVDTGSTDATGEIAARYQAQVYHLDWPDDFAAARNVSLAHATEDWVLVLDADEVLNAEVGQQLKALSQGTPLFNGDPNHVIAVNLLRQEIGSPQAPYSLITRFFRHLPQIQFNRPYHETIDDSVAALQQQSQWQVITLDQVAIYHTGYAPEVVLQRDKFTRARTLMERHLEHQPEDSYILNKLAALYLEQDNSEAALHLLNRGLDQSDAADALTRYELHYHRALTLRHPNPGEAALDYQAALAQEVPPRLKLGSLINFGNLKKDQGDLPGAVKLFQQAVEADPTLAMAHYNLGVAQRLRGYLDEAIAAYQQAIALEPYYAEAHQNLGVALFKLGQLPEALQSFGRATQIYEQVNPDRAVALRQKVKNLGVPQILLAQSYFA